jgi:hypothetical protein
MPNQQHRCRLSLRCKKHLCHRQKSAGKWAARMNVELRIALIIEKSPGRPWKYFSVSQPKSRQ